MTITEFLLARITEDEADARAAALVDNGTYYAERHEGIRYTSEPFWSASFVNDYEGGLQVIAFDEAGERDVAHAGYLDDRTEETSVTRHIARHDPARVLAECEAKRRIVEEHAGESDLCACEEYGSNLPAEKCPILRSLAAVYADHRDYDPEWAL